MKKYKYLLILSIVIITVVSFFMYQKYDKSEYLSAMEEIQSYENPMWQILYRNKASEYENQKVKLYGYKDLRNSEFHANTDFLLKNGPVLKNTEFIKMYKSYKDKQLLKPVGCSKSEVLTEINGVFNVRRDGEGGFMYYYITEIEDIYHFDTRPLAKGGGAKVLCYQNK